MEVLGRNGTFINTIYSLDTSVCCPVEAAGKPEYLDNLIEEFEMYTGNKLKEGTKEQENLKLETSAQVIYLPSFSVELKLLNCDLSVDVVSKTFQ
jgi:hypothetical protein